MAKARWVNLGGHPYTGVFKGADSVIVRASFSGEPGREAERGGAVGFAAKFLRDGVESGNFLGLEEVETLNFFENGFTTHATLP